MDWEGERKAGKAKQDRMTGQAKEDRPTQQMALNSERRERGGGGGQQTRAEGRTGLLWESRRGRRRMRSLRRGLARSASDDPKVRAGGAGRKGPRRGGN